MQLFQFVILGTDSVGEKKKEGGGGRRGGDDRDWSPTRCPAWRGYDILSESALKNPLRTSHTVSVYVCVRARACERVLL